MEDIKTMTLPELAELVSSNPWFNAARVELARRTGQWEDAALYVLDRRKLFFMANGIEHDEAADESLTQMLESYKETKPYERKVHVVGGDFFSQDAYDAVRDKDDNIFSNFAAKIRTEDKEKSEASFIMDFCTETLAEIYVEQGYYEQAKYIYSKLILRYPEKSAYFAALIDKLDSEIKK